jgi:Fe(3+) dicitrate transport protein
MQNQILALFACLFALNAWAQTNGGMLTDTSHLSAIEVSSVVAKPIRFPADTNGMMLLGGKKVEIVDVANQNISLVNNNSRQVFARVAGIQVWESDGSGAQVNVGSRGLSPNRSWEFNVRQNHYDISADPFGYPEAYYNPPMEAVKRIEIIRGAASLQYGPQFGGLLNYVTDAPEGDDAVHGKTTQTLGSFGMMSSYNALKFNGKRFSVHGYYHFRKADGWRQNSAYTINNAFIKARYDFSKKLMLNAEFTRLNYVNQQAGGLTDSLFSIDPSASLRNRNWFNVPWLIPQVELSFKPDSNTSLTLSVFGLIGERNSVGFTADLLHPDTLNTATGKYTNRRVDRDAYQNYGSELRFRKNWSTTKNTHFLAAGIRYFKGNTRRQQDGKGSTGKDFNLTLEPDSDFKRDLNFITTNAAFFAENQFNIGKRFSVSPGFRVEILAQQASGRFGVINNESVPFEGAPQTRFVLLGGFSAEYKIKEEAEIYGGLNKNFRPVLYSDLTPPATTDTVDIALKDASGYTAELGYRKRTNWLYTDVSLYYLLYNNRIGTLAIAGPAGGTRQFRTNIGTSVSMGVEYFLEVSIPKMIQPGCCKEWDVKIFASGTYQNAEYTRLPKTKLNNSIIETTELSGNKVEYAPEWILRSGLNFKWHSFELGGQISHTSEVFASADNNSESSANGNDGKVPAYTVADVNLSYTVKQFVIKAGINNLFNERYFTRRAGGYPGPGILPAEARNAWISLGFSF